MKIIARKCNFTGKIFTNMQNYSKHLQLVRQQNYIRYNFNNYLREIPSMQQEKHQVGNLEEMTTFVIDNINTIWAIGYSEIKRNKKSLLVLPPKYDFGKFDLNAVDVPYKSSYWKLTIRSNYDWGTARHLPLMLAYGMAKFDWKEDNIRTDSFSRIVTQTFILTNPWNKLDDEMVIRKLSTDHLT